MKIKLDKIASSTRNCRLTQEVILSDDITAKDGYVIAVKTLEEKSVYNQLELVSGRMTRICKGDLIAGVLGERKALRGYTGVVPPSVRVGDCKRGRINGPACQHASGSVGRGAWGVKGAISDFGLRISDCGAALVHSV